MKSTERNKEIVRRWNEYLNSGNLAVYDDLGAANYVMHEASRDSGLKELTASMPTWREVFPDGRLTVEDMVAEGDKVAIRYSFRGTHKGSFYGIPATGKQVSYTGMSFYRLVGGKIVEDWPMGDALTLMQQIGAVRQFP